MTIDPLKIPPGLGILAVKILIALVSRGAMNLTTISGVCGVSTGAMSGALQRLVLKGFVGRLHHPSDRRQILFDIAPQGRALVAQWEGEPVPSAGWSSMPTASTASVALPS